LKTLTHFGTDGRVPPITLENDHLMANSTIQLHPPAEKKTLWAWTLGTFFGAGLLKPGPGTYGSIAALLLWYGSIHLLQPSPLAQAIGTAVAAIVITLIGIPAATIVARESGRKDPGHVVIDEAAGQLIALIFCPPDWAHAILALLLFRAFDILKPPPIRQLERLPEGTGIMLDDVAAGLFALAVFALIHLWY
jgi:phosphatidylglycerophosphatase A